MNTNLRLLHMSRMKVSEAFFKIKICLASVCHLPVHELSLHFFLEPPGLFQSNSAQWSKQNFTLL